MAGYVAIEQVHGKLADKDGNFVLQHYGIMYPSDVYLKLEVVPESGTGALKGLSGSMSIKLTKVNISMISIIIFLLNNHP